MQFEVLANAYRGDYKDLIYTGHIAVVDYRQAAVFLRRPRQGGFCPQLGQAHAGHVRL